MSALEVRTRVPAAVWNGYFKFAIERNPWDKVWSHYHMLKAGESGLTFDRYLRTRRLPHNRRLYTERDGERLLVDRVVRYERLNEELGEVLRPLGVPYDGTLETAAKSQYRQGHPGYRDGYTEEQRALVGALFAGEIRMHGYRF